MWAWLRSRIIIVNLRASEKFSLILKNRSFIKEKGFYHPEDFFRNTIAKKEWKTLCQPLRPFVTMVVHEFYADLTSHLVKQVQVWGVLVDFDAFWDETQEHHIPMS